MEKTNLGLVAFCKQALAGGTGYVYGTIGQTCTKDLLDQCAARYPANNLAGGAMRRVGNKWIGRRVTDCIGLLKYYVMAEAYGKNPSYISKYDKSANGAYNEATEKGPISTLPEIPGICLHMPGHFGVYIGGGYAIEAKGTAYGVVKTKVAGRGWTHWFKSPWIKYVTSTTIKSDTTCGMTMKVGAEYKLKLTADFKPECTAGSPGIVQISDAGSSGRDYFFRITALKAGTTGIYANRQKLFVVTVK